MCINCPAQLKVYKRRNFIKTVDGIKTLMVLNG